MIIQKLSRGTVFAVMVSLLGLSACSPEVIDDQIGFIPFEDQFINLTLPSYQALRLDGGSQYLNNIGVKGVILYRKSSVEYLAFERNCTFMPAEACATVNVHVSRLYMNDPCCGSSFDFVNGNPTGGPASRPLRQYRTTLDGNILVITDEIL